MVQPILVILAGGRGERFWPLSRRHYPKQLLKLLHNQSLLQTAVDRVTGLVEPNRIIVVTNRDYEAEVRVQLPQLPLENIIVEPESRNTAAAVGLAAILIRKRLLDSESNPVLAFMPSDLLVTRPEIWREFLLAGSEYCSKTERVVIPGSRPTRPETGFGYIRLGMKIDDIGGFPAYHVREFVEKPNENKAQSYFENSDYLWNSGISIWKQNRLLKEIQTNLPSLWNGLQKIDTAMDGPQSIETINQAYSEFPSISIDTGLLEKVKDLVVIAADYGWDDLGSWAALGRILPQDESGNISFSHQDIQIDSDRTMIVSPKKPVVTLDTHGLIIIETDDVLMICSEERIRDTQIIVDKIKELKRLDLL